MTSQTGVTFYTMRRQKQNSKYLRIFSNFKNKYRHYNHQSTVSFPLHSSFCDSILNFRLIFLAASKSISYCLGHHSNFRLVDLLSIILATCPAQFQLRVITFSVESNIPVRHRNSRFGMLSLNEIPNMTRSKASARILHSMEYII